VSREYDETIPLSNLKRRLLRVLTGGSRLGWHSHRSVFPEHLSHLSLAESTDVQSLVAEFSHVFGDIPSQSTVLEHDIDLGSTPLIKQHPYRVNPTKYAQLQHQVHYMSSHVKYILCVYPLHNSHNTVSKGFTGQIIMGQVIMTPP